MQIFLGSPTTLKFRRTLLYLVRLLALRSFSEAVVGEEGLEPSRPYGHTLLKRTRIPVPPLALNFLKSGG